MYGQKGAGTMSYMINDLVKPWSKSEIKWRVGSVNKDKTKALPLAYIDARTVMERLDSAVGTSNWQDRYEFHGERTICYLSIKIENEWITKADGAGDSPVEGAKGGLSDAFKRAAIKWGMGRELYEMKCKWMPINEYKQLIGNPWDYLINSEIAPKTTKPSKIKTQEEIEALQICKDITEMLKSPFKDKDDCLHYWNGCLDNVTSVMKFNHEWAQTLQDRFNARMEELNG